MKIQTLSLSALLLILCNFQMHAQASQNTCKNTLNAFIQARNAKQYDALKKTLAPSVKFDLNDNLSPEEVVFTIQDYFESAPFMLDKELSNQVVGKTRVLKATFHKWSTEKTPWTSQEMCDEISTPRTVDILVKFNEAGKITHFEEYNYHSNNFKITDTTADLFVNPGNQDATPKKVNKGITLEGTGRYFECSMGMHGGIYRYAEVTYKGKNYWLLYHYASQMDDITYAKRT